MSEKKVKKRIVKWTAGIAAVFVLLFAGLFGTHVYQMNYSVDSVVSLDVNPSIEIKVNQKEKVLAVNPLNEDGKTVIGDMNFKGSSIEVTVNALIGSMVRNGYLNDISNFILVSVCGNNSTKANALQEKLSEQISTILGTDTFSGSVLSQIVASDPELQKLAEQYGISLGKAQLIWQFISQEPQYSFEDLAGLTISELDQMCKTNGISLEDIQSAGNMSDNAYIGTKKAKEIAFTHAGVTAEDDVIKLEIEMDYEHNRMIYEVSFFYENCKYNYDINAATGEITEAKSNPVENKEKEKNGSTAEYIGEEKAREIVLLHAQLTVNEITDYKCGTYVQKDTPVYKIKFDANGYEYSCDINALTGEIVKYDSEPQGKRN